MALLSPDRVEELHNLYGKPVTIDDVFRLRGNDEAQCPILAYPRGESLTDYELFTGRDIDRLVDQACWVLSEKGFKTNDDSIVALFAQSDLSYSITMLALLRMGYKLMTISTRLGHLACKSLLDRVDCKTIIYGSTPRLISTLEAVSADKPDITLHPILSRTDFDRPEVPWKPFIRQRRDEHTEQRRVALIMHSSGSTGYPKPLYQCHAGVLGDLLTGMGCVAFNPLPWFHLHGFLTSLQAIWMRKLAYLWNARLPLTADNIITAMRAVKPEIFHGVPYTVKLLSEVPEGIELLRNCKHVTSGGARPPDELGDKLTREGVHFATTFGLTETGHIGDSMRREPGDNDWAYLRLHSFAIPHIVFEKIENSRDSDTYEAVFLKSHPALLMSNSDNPPGCYRSGDIFIAHPTIANAWKYIARNDDCITLANGEKINPMAMEGVLRQHPLAKDALMFGVDQALPGMMIFQSQHAAHMSDEEYMAAIEAALEEANGFADDFARISPDMVVLLPAEIEYPVTDKNNIIRAAAYRIFDKQIQAAYTGGTNGNAHRSGQSSLKKKLRLSIADLEQYIIDQVKAKAKIDLGAEDDFFSAGIDSLMAIQIRRSLVNDIDIRDAVLPTNVVYDSRNPLRLAGLLYALGTGESALNNGGLDLEAESLAEMEHLIQKYGTFGIRAGDSQRTPQEDVVVLTGATGALGAHLLHKLLYRPNVRHIYCLVRSSSQNPRDRVLDSLLQRGIDVASLDSDLLSKFSAHHTSNFGDDNLGLSLELYHQIRSQTTLIAHAAWPVHFQLPLVSFESHISGLRNLLELAIQTPWDEPARLLFASSIATAYATPRLADGTPALIAERPIPSLSHSLGTGYAQSKLVCERICERAASTGVKVGVMRIGQIVGDVDKGIWNPKESIPLMVQSALVTGTLPLLDGEQGFCEWMPVDTMAEACLQVDDSMRSKATNTNGHHAAVNGKPHTNGTSALNVTHSNNGTSVTNGDLAVKEVPIHSHAHYYNLVSPKSHTWSTDVLPALSQAGLKFKQVPFQTWLANIKNYTSDTEETTTQKLPATKLVRYYEDLYGDPTGKTTIARFDLSKGIRDLPALRDCPDVVESGLIAKFLSTWLNVWQK